MTDVEAAYIAGIIDSEGTITIDAPKGSEGRRMTALVTVTMNDRPSLELIQRCLCVGNIGRPLRRNAKHKLHHRYTAKSLQAKQVVEGLLPFLRLKRPQAEILIELCNMQAKRRGNRHLTDIELDRRVSLLSRIRLLNKRGSN